MAQQNVIVRLSLKDGDVVRAGLQALGADGDKALKRIEAAARTPSPALKALGAASDELKSQMGGLAGQAGAFGTALRTLGPGGLAAAAGVGAMVAGFTALMARTRQAIDQLDELGDKAAKIGVGAEYLQEMRYSLEQLGVPVERIDDALAAFNVTVGKVGLRGDDAAKKVRVAFAALGISLSDVQKSDPTQLLQRVATEISKIKDTARQAAIAKQLGIEDLLPALREGGDAIAKLREDARRLGIVLDEDLVKNAGKAKNELDTMQRIVDAQLTQALVNATPLVVGFAKAFASVAEWAGRAVDKLNQVEQRATHTLKVEIEDLGLQIEEKNRQIASLRGSGVPFGPKEYGPERQALRGVLGLPGPEAEIAAAEEEVRRMQSDIARRQAILDARERLLKEKPRTGGGGGTIDLGDEGRKSRKQPEYVDFAGNAITPTEDQLYFLAHPPKPRTWQDLEAFQKAADDIEQRNQQLMDSLQRQWLQASGERIRLIEYDRDAAIKGLDDQELSEQQHAEAVTLINQTAAREIAGERVRLADSIKSPDQLGVQSVFSLTDAFKGMGVAASSAFEDAIAGGKGFSEILQGLATDLEKLLVRKFATEPVMRLLDMGITAGGNALTQWWTGYSSHTVTADWTNLQGLKAAHGGVFEGGNVIPFARGGLIERPTIFPMARGYGLMGEAGPEAVMPLKRLPSGRLGVEAGGGPQVNVVINNNAGAQVTARERKDERGGLTIDVMIDAVEQAMASRATRPGTTLNRALAQAANPVRAR